MTDENNVPKLPALASGGTAMAIIPQSFDEAWRIALAVTKAGMAPKGLEEPEQCMIIILHGLEVGLPPMMALQSIALINNRPTIWGDGALGLVYSSNKMEFFKEWTEGEADSRVAFCEVRRKGFSEPTIGRFSVLDAKAAGLWQTEPFKKRKDGSTYPNDSPWFKYQPRMLKMRARSWALRDAFSDVLKGLAIREEWQDIEHDPDEPVRLARPTPPRVPPKPPVKEQVEQTKPAEQTKPKAEEKPKTPAKAKAKPKDEPKQVGNASFEDDDGKVGTAFKQQVDQMVENEEPAAGDLLEAMDEAMEQATTAADVEEVWNEHDLEARLESLTGGTEFQNVAAGIRRKHLSRVNA